MRVNSWNTTATVTTVLIFISAILNAATVMAQNPPNQDEPNKIQPRPRAMNARVALLESQVDKMIRTINETHGPEQPAYLRNRTQEMLAELADIEAVISTISQSVSNGNMNEGEQNARLDDIAAEVTTLWNEIESLKKFVMDETFNPTTGYDNGFFIKSRDEKFRLTIMGFVRPYYSLSVQKDWETNDLGAVVEDSSGDPMGGDPAVRQSTFGVANARLAFQLELLDVIGGKIEVDYGTLAGYVQYPVNTNPGNAVYNRVEIEKSTLRFLDVYGEYVPAKEFRVRAGQMKVPFDRESGFFANNLSFATRSLVTRPYLNWADDLEDTDPLFAWGYEMQRAGSFGRDVGVEVAGSLGNGLFAYALGAFNGSGGNVLNDNRDMLVALRVSSDLLGPMTPGMSDLETTREPLLSIGAAFAYDLLGHVHNADPTEKYNSSDGNLTADMMLKWRGLSAMAAVYYRNSKHGSVFKDAEGNEYPIDSFGFAGQLAYFNDRSKLEPAYRYSFWDADMAASLDHVNEHTFSLGFHPFPNHMKIQIQYRALVPAKFDRSYLQPNPTISDQEFRFDPLHEFTVMTQVAF